MKNFFFKPSTLVVNENIKRLLVLRAVGLAGQVIAVLLAIYHLGIKLPVVQLFSVFFVASVWGFISILLLRNVRKTTDHVFFLQLVFDVLELTAVLYLTGGATNPFAWFLLVPHSIAASLLSRHYAWLMAVLVSACYTLVVFYYLPLSHGTHKMDMSIAGHFQMHIIGMWIGFVLSAFLMAYFVAGMAENLRRRNKLLAKMQERMFRDERLVALGTLATGAAHELGTPLGTMDIVTHELVQQFNQSENKQIKDKLDIIQGQIKRCKKALSSITETATQQHHGEGQVLPIDTYLQHIILQWQVSHVTVELQQSFQGEQPAPTVITDLSLAHALVNVLDNAAQSSPHAVALLVSWNDQQIKVIVEDEGGGLSKSQLASLGTELQSSKNMGLGVGLYITKATIERIGGTIMWENRKTKGLRVTMTLPVQNNDENS